MCLRQFVISRDVYHIFSILKACIPVTLEMGGLVNRERLYHHVRDVIIKTGAGSGRAGSPIAFWYSILCATGMLVRVRLLVGVLHCYCNGSAKGGKKVF